MKKYRLEYSRYDVDLEGSSKEELIRSYFRLMNGPENVLNHFLKHVRIIEGEVPDAIIVEDKKQ